MEEFFCRSIFFVGGMSAVRRLLLWGTHGSLLGKGCEPMNMYVTSATIKSLREKRKLTQAELAERIGVSSKTVSKWETARGLPDISLLQPLAQALNISVIELMSGAPVTNRNPSANMLRTEFYVCPVCGNVIHSAGRAVVSCCGITLPALEAEEGEEEHSICIAPVEDECFVSLCHPMTKVHHISFVAYVTCDRVQLVKLYPEGEAALRLPLRKTGVLYWYCSHHGLFRKKL